jgi:NAD(P)-dependent dehydrogenase (short-subunit alcohol dehydrogenase family)
MLFSDEAKNMRHHASRLTGKIAIITGASQGMGMAHARAFVCAGSREVILGDLNENEKAGKAFGSRKKNHAKKCPA